SGFGARRVQRTKPSERGDPAATPTLNGSPAGQLRRSARPMPIRAGAATAPAPAAAAFRMDPRRGRRILISKGKPRRSKPNGGRLPVLYDTFLKRARIIHRNRVECGSPGGGYPVRSAGGIAAASKALS